MRRSRGVTYLALLLAIALVSSVLAASASIWSHAQRREREKQLLWAGDQFRRALLAYARAGNGTYPRRIEDLLEDSRSLTKRRFLRQIYEDPMTRSTEWGLVRNVQGAIVGVYSRSEEKPIKVAQFPTPYDRFEKAKTYTEWKFAAVSPPVDPKSQAQPDADAADRARRGQSDGPPASAAQARPSPAPELGQPARAPAATPQPRPHPDIVDRLPLALGDRALPADRLTPPKPAVDRTDGTKTGNTKKPAVQNGDQAKNAVEERGPAGTATASTPAATPAATPAQAPDRAAPDSPPRAIADTVPPGSSVFAPSPLTPLQSLQSPYSPSGLPGVPVAPPSSTPLRPASPPDAPARR